MSGVLIDYAGTLTTLPAEFDFSQPWRAYTQALVDIGRATAAGAPDVVARLVAAEEVSYQDCLASGRGWTFADILDHADVPNERSAQRAYFACFNRGTEVSHSGRTVLAALGARDIPVVLVSNTLWPKAWIVQRLVACDVYRYLTGIVVSSDLDVCKPHPEIFHRGLAALGPMDAEDVVMVGDRLHEDIGGGAGIGLRTVWLRPDPGQSGALGGITPTVTIDDLTELLSLI